MQAQSIMIASRYNYCPDTPCNYDYKHAHGPTDGPTQHQGWIPDPRLPNFTLQAEPNLIEKQASQYEYADLQAQENMARATNWIAWFSFLGFITAGAGVVLLVRNLSVTREVGRDQSRAYLHVQSARISDTNARFMIKVSNTGATPARWFEVSGFGIFDIASEGDVHSFVPPPIPNDAKSSRWTAIANGDALTAPAPFRDQEKILGDFYASGDYGRLTIIGKVRYETVFGEVYSTEFCFFTGQKTHNHRKVNGEETRDIIMSRPTAILKTYDRES